MKRSKSMKSIQIIIGALDTAAPTQPYILTPFSVPRWLALFVLFLFWPGPGLSWVTHYLLRGYSEIEQGVTEAIYQFSLWLVPAGFCRVAACG